MIRDPTLLLQAYLAKHRSLAELSTAISKKTIHPQVKSRLADYCFQTGIREEAFCSLLSSKSSQEEETLLREQILKQDRKHLLRQIMEKGNVAKGESLFHSKRLSCSRCHFITGPGDSLGPNLYDIGSCLSVTAILDSLLNPDQKIQPLFEHLSLTTTRNETMSGRLDRWDEESLFFRNRCTPDKAEQIYSTQIKSLKQVPTSLMPPLIVNRLETEQELFDLMKFLSEAQSPIQHDTSNHSVIMQWKYRVLPKQASRINRDDLKSTPFELPVETFRNGELPLKPFFKTASKETLLLTCRLQVYKEGAIQLQANELKGLQLWLDGQPILLQEDLNLTLMKGDSSIHLCCGLETANRTEFESSIAEE